MDNWKYREDINPRFKHPLQNISARWNVRFERHWWIPWAHGNAGADILLGTCTPASPRSPVVATVKRKKEERMEHIYWVTCSLRKCLPSCSNTKDFPCTQHLSLAKLSLSPDIFNDNLNTSLNFRRTQGSALWANWCSYLKSTVSFTLALKFLTFQFRQLLFHSWWGMFFLFLFSFSLHWPILTFSLNFIWSRKIYFFTSTGPPFIYFIYS